MGKVLRECERRYEEVEERVKKVAVEVYEEEETGWKGRRYRWLLNVDLSGVGPRFDDILC